VARVLILLKMVYWRLESTFRPKTVRAIRVGGEVIDDNVQKAVYALLTLNLFVFAGGSVFMAGLGLPFATACSSVTACLFNIGPGLDYVGAASNFADVPTFGKAFLSLCMVMGRLEMFSVAVLFVPAFWRTG